LIVLILKAKNKFNNLTKKCSFRHAFHEIFFVTNNNFQILIPYYLYNTRVTKNTRVRKGEAKIVYL